jgi:hypothetical protein
MCRNITMLRGLDPPATPDEVAAASLQYVRKIGAISAGPLLDSPAVAEAVRAIAAATEKLLETLPPRRTPPLIVPPGRRRRSASSND